MAAATESPEGVSAPRHEEVALEDPHLQEVNREPLAETQSEATEVADAAGTVDAPDTAQEPPEPHAQDLSDMTVSTEQLQSRKEGASASAAPSAGEQQGGAYAAVAEGPQAAGEASTAGETAPTRVDNFSIYKEAVLRMDAQLGEIPTLKAIADKLRIPPLAVAGAGSFGILAFCLWGFCGQLVSTFLGMILPAYESFKTVEAFSNIADPSNTGDLWGKASAMQFWLMYWIVVAAFASCEYFLYWILAWVPFYYPIKLLVLLYLWLPQTKGANHMYHFVVCPILRRNRRRIDSAIEEGGKHIKQTFGGAVTNVGKAGLSAGAGGVVQLGAMVTTAVPELGGMIARRLSSVTAKPERSHSD